MLALTQHDQQAAGDYALLRSMGIRTARDGVRWHLIERAGRFDFTSLALQVEAAQANEVQLIWNLCHYGWPDDLDLFSPAFIGRFARFCRAVARFLAEHSSTVPYYVPINEISFFSWAAGQAGYIHPFGVGRGTELKKHLVRAAIAGIEAIWAVDSRARIAIVDPLIHVVAPRGRPDLVKAAAAKTASQFEAAAMLAGQIHPELGGHPRYLDIVGLNYYHANQWELPESRLRWEDDPRDDRWVPLHRLLAQAYDHYRRPLFIAETSHFGAGRAPWLREVALEVRQARAEGVPVEGICLYPILDRPDWDNFKHWHNSGLWDLVPDRHDRLQRVLDPAYSAELRSAAALLAEGSRFPV